VPDTFFASLFSGRFALTPDDDGAYYLDRDGRQFHHILNYLRNPHSSKLNADLSEGQRGELEEEARFYGLLDRMMPGPYSAQSGGGGGSGGGGTSDRGIGMGTPPPGVQHPEGQFEIDDDDDDAVEEALAATGLLPGIPGERRARCNS
jgi:hypothetical protein